MILSGEPFIGTLNTELRKRGRRGEDRSWEFRQECGKNPRTAVAKTEGTQRQSTGAIVYRSGQAPCSPSPGMPAGTLRSQWVAWGGRGITGNLAVVT